MYVCNMKTPLPLSKFPKEPPLPSPNQKKEKKKGDPITPAQTRSFRPSSPERSGRAQRRTRAYVVHTHAHAHNYVRTLTTCRGNRVSGSPDGILPAVM